MCSTKTCYNSSITPQKPSTKMHLIPAPTTWTLGVPSDKLIMMIELMFTLRLVMTLALQGLALLVLHIPEQLVNRSTKHHLTSTKAPRPKMLM